MNHLGTAEATVLGTMAQSMDIRHHNIFWFQFRATADVAEGEGAQFNIQCALPSEADNCVPGDWEQIPEVVVCGLPAEPAESSVVALQGEILTSTVCKVTIPCACHGFIRVIPAGGAAQDPNFPSGAEASFEVIGLVDRPKR